MPTLYLDVESRSAISLALVGAWIYAAHRSTEILCACYAVDDGEVQTWVNRRLLDPNATPDPAPEPFLAAARDSASWDLVAHNIEFERAMLEHKLIPEHGFPPIPLESQHCSMLLALANAYPA